MVDHAPRDLSEWMRSVERRLASASRAAANIPFTYNEKLKGDILADKLRRPTAPVEITYETAYYQPDGLGAEYGRLFVEFPDVTKATDGTDIPIKEYELWGRDDTTNYLEATTSAVAGLAAPGLTIPGLAATDAMKAKAVTALAPFRRLAVSAVSSLRVDNLVPGSVWTFKVRAIGRFTTDAGEFSPEFQTQVDADTTAPPQPTAPELAASHGTITVRWGGLSVLGSMPGDFANLEVAGGYSSSPTELLTRFYRGGGLTVVSDLEYYKPYFVRFRAVDLSGNKSPWSEQSVEFTTPLVDTDVILSEIDADKTTIRNIGEEAIKDGAIRQEKLADGAVALEKLDAQVREQVQSGVDALAALGPLQSDLTTLQTSASGKTAIINSVDDASPSVPGAAPGDRWQKWSTLAAGGKLLASWRWSGTSWIPELMDPAYLPLVDIGQGTFGSLNGSRLEANSIQTKALAVSDPTNFAPSPAESPGDWNLTGGMTIVNNSSISVAGSRFEAVGNTSTAWAYGPMKAVTPGEKLYAAATVYRSTSTDTTGAYLRFQWYDKNKATLASPQYTGTQTTGPSGTRMEVVVEVPAGAAYAILTLPIVSAGAGKETLRTSLYDVVAKRQTGAVLIEDGAVTANKVAVNAITAKNIVVGDFQNLAIGSDFEDAAAVPWNLHTDHTIQSTSSRGMALRMGPGTLGATRGSYFNGDLRVREGEQWYFSYWAYIDSAFDGDGNSKLRVAGNPAGSHMLSVSYDGIVRNTWTKLEGTLTVPAGITSLSLMLWSTNGAGYAFIDDVQVRRKAEASLIQNLGVEQLTATSAAMSQAVIDKLWADVVNSRKITAEMVAISKGGNAFMDPDIQDTANWGGGFASTTGGRSGKGSVLIPASATQAGSYYGTTATIEKTGMRLVAGATYRLGAWVRSDQSIPANQVRIYFRIYDTLGGWGFASDVANNVPQNSATIPANTWTFISGMVKVPDTTTYLYGVLGLFKQATFTTGAVRWSDPSVQQAAGGELIVDGAITATHLGVDSVTASAIKALTITAGELAANAVEADKIKAGAVVASKLEATLALVTEIAAGPTAGAHASMDPTGFKVYAVDADDGSVDPVVNLGTSGADDYFQITDAAGQVLSSMNKTGTVLGQTMDAKSELYYKGTELQSILDALPRGLVTWRQFPRPSSYTYPTLPSAGGEVGLFEIGWDTSQDSPARMYKVNVPKMLVKSLSGSATTCGLTMRFTDDGTAPTVSSQLITSDWGYASAGGWRSAGFNNQLVGSANGPYIRILISMWSTGGCSLDAAALPMISVEDAGISTPQGGSYTTGGGTVGGGTTAAAPANPVVTKSVEYSPVSGGIRSFLPAGGQYAYQVGKGYQGLSPAGYGNLKSMYVFPSVTGLLTGATVNDIWIYLYFEHWYNNAGGYAKIGLHPNSAMPATWNTNTTLQITSPLWPKGSGRYVRLPDSTYAGFVSGAWRGFTLLGDSTYNTYGIANSARLKIRYTK